MNRRFLRWTGRAVCAGALALALLCLLCSFYYNVPVHYANQGFGTEYKWEPHRFYCKSDEGFAWGRTNNDGFNNLRDFTPGDRLDILLMGSSHMEAFNVAQDENAAALLNERYGGERTVYNIGTAAHTFLYCVKNLDGALRYYAPSGWVVIETMSLDFSGAEMDAVVDGSYPDLPSRSGGLLTLVQKLSFLRVIYTQYIKRGDLFNDAAARTGAQPIACDEAYEAALTRLLDKLARESGQNGVRACIVFMPPLLIAEDGGPYTETDSEKLSLFTRLCAERGIEFIDMTGPFLDAYAQHRLPFGFANTAPTVGHLNPCGHRLFADAVAARIAEREG